MLWLVKFYHKVICRISSPVPCCSVGENVPHKGWNLQCFQIAKAGVGAEEPGQKDCCFLTTCVCNLPYLVLHFHAELPCILVPITCFQSFVFAWKKERRKLCISQAFKTFQSYLATAEEKWVGDGILTFVLERNACIKLAIYDYLHFVQYHCSDVVVRFLMAGFTHVAPEAFHEYSLLSCCWGDVLKSFPRQDKYRPRLVLMALWWEKVATERLDQK